MYGMSKSVKISLKGLYQSYPIPRANGFASRKQLRAHPLQWMGIATLGKPNPQYWYYSMYSKGDRHLQIG